jgi:radical SAM protein with 4Fe4S-binding SPASM domain
MDFRQLIEWLIPRAKSPLKRLGIAPGLYHYLREVEGTFTRFHLRVDSTGNGLLLANASAAARLRPSGIIIAKGLLEGDLPTVIAERLMASFYDATPGQVADDVERVQGIISTLEAPGDNYPIVNLADPSFSAEIAPLDRPLSADVPLAEPDRLVPILDRLWELGIPHVTLIAGEQPKQAALVRAVERAEDLGLIAGVRARGSDLVEGSLIKDLAQAGVDHVDVPYLSAQPQVHDALMGAGDHQKAVQALAEVHQNEVCPVAELALVETTSQRIEETVESLGSQGVTNACFFAIAMAEGRSSGGALPAEELIQVARLVEESAEESQVRYLWYPPVRFHLGASLARDVRRGPRCSGDHAVRVEPDGSVIPARGPYRSAGNLLTDPWEKIHRHEVFRNYRRRVETDTHCDDCPGLAICAADCPRNPAGWADGRGQG